MDPIIVNSKAAITIFEAQGGYVVHVGAYGFRSYNCISETEAHTHVCKTRVEVGRLVIDRLARCHEDRDADKRELKGVSGE